jgi:hypothetical protein
LGFFPVGTTIHAREDGEGGSSGKRVGSSATSKGTRNSSTEGSAGTPTRFAGQTYLTKLIYILCKDKGKFVSVLK